MTSRSDLATGAPGIAARWTSSMKSGVGTALWPGCRTWFTISHGILNEVYYPRLDRACIRDLGLIVTGPDGYLSEEKRHAVHSVEPIETGVPGYRLINIAGDGRYRIEKTVIVDPLRQTVLQHIKFEALEGKAGDYRVYALLAPHLVNAGAHNNGWVGHYKGMAMLMASGSGVALALASSEPWGDCSAGYVGSGDGWRQLHRHGQLDTASRQAEDGNVALTGEIRFSAEDGTATLALGFGPNANEAAYNAQASLNAGFAATQQLYAKGWRDWQAGLVPLDRTLADGRNSYRISTGVLASHREAGFPGPAVASLSIPWGASMGDENIGGYHLVWPRDLVETAGGFLAAGAPDDALDILFYLRTIQEEDGHWPQNAWLDGTPYWQGIQMDECAFPILLTDLLYRQHCLDDGALHDYLPMIERAAAYVIGNGPVTQEDRWEEDAGYSPFTLAVEIAALLAAADLLEVGGRREAAALARETADCWNEQIEDWTYVSGNPTCEDIGVAGYYVRIAPPLSAAQSLREARIPIKNRPLTEGDHIAAEVVSPDALALVRFGLRAPDDPRIRDTVTVIDAQLRRDMPQGPLWYRYSGDGYGEHHDGKPFDGIGQGRLWPLLTGERAHYELAAGRKDVALEMLETLEGSAGPGGMLPEQSWDADDIPQRELYRGRPSGSAMPLVWAHAEHIKLLRSLRDGAVFDQPPQTVKRYVEDKTGSPLRVWRFIDRIATLPAGKLLRIATGAPAQVHWSVDGWATSTDTHTLAPVLGQHVVDLPVAALAAGQQVDFTFYWPDVDHWENANFTVAIV